MAIIKSFSPFQNLSNFSTFIVDSNPNSEFFRITEFKETFSGGKNGFLIEGSEFLKETTEVKIEILDVEGNPVYYEPGKGTPDYYEGLSTLVSVHIYPDTPIGIGKITILGELKQYIDSNGTLRDVPSEWQGVYNVKWERTFKINRNLFNEDIVRFYRRPSISISELVKPIFSKTIPTVTQSGSVEGTALQPSLGSNLSTWTAGTLYKLKITDSSVWTGSVDENIINVPALSYTPTVREVLNSKEVLVDVPYSVGNIVTNFTSTPYTTSFEFVEGQQTTESALTGSFARIQISNLKTFVGDVARVKVFRKSRNEVTDFQFVQESKLESTELLRDITVSNDTEISYGNFSDYNLTNYWVTLSNQHPVSVNVDVLQSSLKTDYNTSVGGVQNLITSESFSITKDVEYTLTFKTLLSGSIDGSEYIRAYLSSSDYQQTFLTVSGSGIYKTRQTLTQNIIASPISSSNAKLVFEISGSDWYISNVSLKNAQETSFSPDEFVLVQEIPRKLASETFDFRFEFYDINNNYIPVDVNASATFNGGNDFPTSTKILTLQSDRNAFRFFTGSIANPPFQQIGFTTTRQNIAGPVTYNRSVFDITGSYISEAQYLALGGTEYPGRLHTSSSAGFVVQIDEFSGSLDTSATSTVRVGFITYTASADGLEDYETIYRLEDGDNAPGLFASSTANQFIYKATDLSLNPSGQVILFDVRRKNLSSTGSPITINKNSQVGTGPSLSLLSDDPTTGVATYFLSGSTYDFLTGSTTYTFTSSDSFGIDFHDQITITPIKILDGLSVNLSNENATLPAKSTGFVDSGSFVLTSGSVSVKVGNENISHSNGLSTNNRFDIISATGTNCTPNNSSPSDATYGITTLTADSGSLNLLVRYKDGAGDTTDITKIATYTKAKKGTPNVLVFANPQSQTINSGSTPSPIIISVKEGSTDYTYGSGVNKFTLSNVSTFYSQSGVNSSTMLYTGSLSTPSSGSALVSYTDSEGSAGSQTISFSIGVSRQGVDGAQGASGSAGATGATGPGLTYVGECSVLDTAFIWTNDAIARNVTSVLGTYYITRTAAHGVTKGTTGCPPNATYFEQLQDFDSVATDIFLAQDATITRGLVMGTFGGNNGFIRSANASSLNSGHGYYLDRDGNLRLGNDTTGSNWLKFQTGSLTVNGSINVLGGNAATNTALSSSLDGKTSNSQTASLVNPSQYSFGPAGDVGFDMVSIAPGTTPGLYLGSNNLGYHSGSQWRTFMSSSGAFFLAGSGNNGLTWNGTTLAIDGQITARTGYIGNSTSGFTIGSTSIYNGKSSITANSAGVYVGVDGISLGAGTPFLVNTNGAVTASNLTLTGGSLQIGNNFSVNSDGFLNAVSGSFTGTITATSGRIGGFLIGSNAITSENNYLDIDASQPHIKLFDTSNQNRVTISNDAAFSAGAGGTNPTIPNLTTTYDTVRSAGPAVTTYIGNSMPYKTGASGSFTPSGWSGETVQLSVNIQPNSYYASTTVTATNVDVTYISNNVTVYFKVVQGANEYLTTKQFIGNQIGTNLTSLNLTGTDTLTLNIPLTNNVYTYEVGIYTGGATASGTQNGFPTMEIDTIYRTPQVTSLTVSYAAEFTEINAAGLQIISGTTKKVVIPRDNSDTYQLKVTGNMYATGNIVAYFSDKRLKNILGNIENPLEKIQKLNGIYYIQNNKANELGYENSDKIEVGLIAQEVQEVLPEVIHLAPIDTKTDGTSKTGENYLSVDYDKIVPLLVESIKELKKEIEELKKNK